MRRVELPILNPCHEDYAAMDGPLERRFCDKCDKHVHNLSEMTEREAKALLDGRDGARLCVRYRCGADGRIKFRPTARKAAFVALVSLAMAACTGYAEPDALESPDSASLCRDASGYAIDCTLADAAVIPEVQPQPEPLPRVQPEPEPEPVSEPEPPEEYELMGDIAGAPEPCPLPQRGTEPASSEEELMGEVREPTRRERRKYRRAERKRQKRDDDDMVLMGVVTEAD